MSLTMTTVCTAWIHIKNVILGLQPGTPMALALAKAGIDNYQDLFSLLEAQIFGLTYDDTSMGETVNLQLGHKAKL